MGLFRRRRSRWLKDVIEGETAIQNDKINAGYAGEIVFRESGLGEMYEEFGEDVSEDVGGSAVTENAPYHNTADYKMVQKNDDGSTISTQSS